jgi:hypothetical protein
MIARVLRVSKQEIAEMVAGLPGEVREAIVFIKERVDQNAEAGEDIFAEMAPFTVRVGGADCSREAIYSPMEGE